MGVVSEHIGTYRMTNSTVTTVVAPYTIIRIKYAANVGPRVFRRTDKA